MKTTELTFEDLRETLTGPSRSMRWHIIPWTDCPECGDAIASPARSLKEMKADDWQSIHLDDDDDEDALGVYDGDPAVCTACRRVWFWSVDEDDAWINDQREGDEDVPMVTVETVVCIVAEAVVTP